MRILLTHCYRTFRCVNSVVSIYTSFFLSWVSSPFLLQRRTVSWTSWTFEIRPVIQFYFSAWHESERTNRSIPCVRARWR